MEVTVPGSPLAGRGARIRQSRLSTGRVMRRWGSGSDNWFNPNIAHRLDLRLCRFSAQFSRRIRDIHHTQDGQDGLGWDHRAAFEAPQIVWPLGQLPSS
jgi:hypothetical protein